VSIQVHIHKTHRQYTGGREIIDVTGATVGECLDHLVRQYPDLQNMLFDGKGKLHNTLEIYLNMESTYPEELARPTRDLDEIFITLMLAGG
jgi:molybdopterin converting factor small subunit